ncbi:MAG: hypothetical protein MRZ79_27760 [Bacteroidia bacterium]|nr:hypothetical protein [Bacteroidia bacterium]
MAKKFLDVLGEAFEEDMLDDVIPNQKRIVPSRRKKKGFLDTLNKNHKTNSEAPKGNKKKKSLLDTMEEALDNQVFDQLFPDSRKRPKMTQKEINRAMESPFSTMITTEVLDRAREIARQKGIRVKDVINAALKLYVDKEAD